MDEFIIIIYETDKIDIPIEERAKWIQELYPQVKIIYAYNPPDQYGLDDQSVEIQMQYLLKYIRPYKVTHFYSSEQYGEKVAQYMGIINRQVDNQRIKFPISATHIRKELEKHKDALPQNVYKDCKEKLK